MVEDGWVPLYIRGNEVAEKLYRDTNALVKARRAEADTLRARVDELERWQYEVAEALGFLNRAEGQDGYEVATPSVIFAQYRALEHERDEALARAQSAEMNADAEAAGLDRMREERNVARRWASMWKKRAEAGRECCRQAEELRAERDSFRNGQGQAQHVFDLLWGDVHGPGGMREQLKAARARVERLEFLLASTEATVKRQIEDRMARERGA